MWFLFQVSGTCLQVMGTPFLPPTNEVCEGYVFTGVCLSTGGACVTGACMVGGGMCGRGGMRGGGAWQGGMCGGGCMAEGHIWQGVCMAGGVMHGRGGSMRGRGACMPDTTRYGDTVNERAVLTRLECILVLLCTRFIFSKAVPSALLMSLEWEL